MKRFSLRKTDRGWRTARRAFTLIEVVVAIVLLATLLVGMVSAYAAHHRQGLLAMQRMQAVEIADDLLAEWYRGEKPTIPRSGQGILPSTTTANAAFRWRTETIHRNRIESLPVDIVRLQIFSARDFGPTPANEPAKTTRSIHPLAQVDVLLPVEQP